MAPPDISTDDMDPALKMMGGMKQFNLSEQELTACKELQATAFLNMAICHHLNGDFQKSVDNCKKSISYNNKVIKAHYRLGQSHKALKQYDVAIKAFKAAIMLNVEDPNDIQSEMN